MEGGEAEEARAQGGCSPAPRLNPLLPLLPSLAAWLRAMLACGHRSSSRAGALVQPSVAEMRRVWAAPLALLSAGDLFSAADDGIGAACVAASRAAQQEQGQGREEEGPALALAAARLAASLLRPLLSAGSADCADATPLEPEAASRLVTSLSQRLSPALAADDAARQSPASEASPALAPRACGLAGALALTELVCSCHASLDRPTAAAQLALQHSLRALQPGARGRRGAAAAHHGHQGHGSAGGGAGWVGGGEALTERRLCDSLLRLLSLPLGAAAFASPPSALVYAARDAMRHASASPPLSACLGLVRAGALASMAALLPELQRQVKPPSHTFSHLLTPSRTFSHLPTPSHTFSHLLRRRLLLLLLPPRFSTTLPSSPR